MVKIALSKEVSVVGANCDSLLGTVSSSLQVSTDRAVGPHC